MSVHSPSCSCLALEEELLRCFGFCKHRPTLAGLFYCWKRCSDGGFSRSTCGFWERIWPGILGGKSHWVWLQESFVCLLLPLPPFSFQREQEPAWLILKAFLFEAIDAKIPPLGETWEYLLLPRPQAQTKVQFPKVLSEEPMTLLGFFIKSTGEGFSGVLASHQQRLCLKILHHRWWLSCGHLPIWSTLSLVSLSHILQHLHKAMYDQGSVEFPRWQLWSEASHVQQPVLDS